MVSDVLTLAEIQARYRSEWVLLEDPETTDAMEVVGGKVLCHSADKAAVYRKARELRPASSAVIYTGKLPKDAVVVL